MEYLIPLEACDHHLAEVVGGKATGLCSLLRRGLPVPPGFAVTTHAYRGFVAGGLGRRIGEVLASAGEGPGELARASGRIRELFEEASPPPDLAAELAGAYRALGEPPVAVRSSAVSEDAAEASFAGEHESYLWVRGEELPRAVLRCWASLFTPQALAYFRHLGIHPAETAMGVVVQAMVEASAAGVMITLDPVSGDPSQVTVEAAFGLGVAVVGGEVTPDRYAVDKVTFEVRSFSPGVKTHAYRFDPGAGEVRATPLPPEEQGAPAITEDEAVELARVGRRLERELGVAQDVEWALGPGEPGARQLYLLQTRPETVWSARRRAPLEDPSQPILERLIRNIRIPMRISDAPGGLGT